jgi:light-harvesting complex I chlorophyll a/b binding protein 1
MKYSLFFANVCYIVHGLIIRPPTAPLQNIAVFDPSNYAGGLEPSFYRESELKHGRLAMMGTLMLPVLEHSHSQVGDHVLGIDAFQALPEDTRFTVVYAMFVCELYTMLIGWENPVNKAFTLKANYQPGDFKIGWNEKKADLDLMDKELNNGRLAMIGMLGMMVQELVTHRPLF